MMNCMNMMDGMSAMGGGCVKTAESARILGGFPPGA